jgi:hypothetical protein
MKTALTYNTELLLRSADLDGLGVPDSLASGRIPVVVPVLNLYLDMYPGVA